MSNITEYLLLIHEDDESSVNRLNEVITLERPSVFPAFNCLAPYLGGTKVGSNTIFGAAMNHFPPKEMIQYIREVTWNEPNSVKLFEKTEIDSAWQPNIDLWDTRTSVEF